MSVSIIPINFQQKRLILNNIIFNCFACQKIQVALALECLNILELCCEKNR